MYSHFLQIKQKFGLKQKILDEFLHLIVENLFFQIKKIVKQKRLHRK